MKRHVLVSLIATGVLLAGIVVGVLLSGPLTALAFGSLSGSGSSSSTSNAHYCQQYVDSLASKLGVSSSTLESDAKSSGVSVIDQMYADKQISEQQKVMLDQAISHLSVGSCSALGNGIPNIPGVTASAQGGATQVGHSATAPANPLALGAGGHGPKGGPSH